MKAGNPVDYVFAGGPRCGRPGVTLTTIDMLAVDLAGSRHHYFWSGRRSTIQQATWRGIETIPVRVYEHIGHTGAGERLHPAGQGGTA